MGTIDTSKLIAVLGPTNTGKTHLAIERMSAHSSGMIGFPLRLLAREVYDRVVALKGVERVALITGEEKIIPPNARWFLCTAESMPLDRDFAFVALDEAQLGIDPERGHVFTDRLLRARGRDETMILGSDALRPMLQKLLPDAEIISRPRFSTLSYAGTTKLSRLPKRSAIVAFSAEEVYAVAEMLRRFRGGAAVVMGALSPHTRNAQVAMFQAGEVDYLVATDAIGMGLNMDVAHVAFASLRKFDGKRQRRLTVSEMAQIAGRAGRHQRDGTFGTLAFDGRGQSFDDGEIGAIENHVFPPLDFLYWRTGDPDISSLDALIADLERKPDREGLRAAPESVDLAVLRRLASEEWVRERARSKAMVGRLWAACGLPDFRKTGAEPHSRLVGRVFRHLSEGEGRLPVQWFADELARLDSMQGDVETLADRIAGVRTWSYIAHRPDWLADPEHWAARTREVETRLSDALHQRLTQRFVDRRTAVLMRDLGAHGSDMLPVTIDEDGQVAVDGEPIGHLVGFRFKVDPTARHADKKRLLAAAERRLGGVLAEKARALAADEDSAFALDTMPGRPAAIFWRGDVVARLEKGRGPLAPRLRLHKALELLAPADAERVTARLETWWADALGRQLGPLLRIAAAARDADTPGPLRALYAPLADSLGLAPREPMGQVVAALDRPMRHAAGRAGIRIGALDLHVAALLKPEPMRWRLALARVHAGLDMPELPPQGAVTLAAPADPDMRHAWRGAGYRPLGAQMVRVDMAERVARALHDRRAQCKAANENFVPDAALATSLGLSADSFTRLLAELGFRRSGPKAEGGWAWRGRPTGDARPVKASRQKGDRPPRPATENAFAVLATLGLGRG